ncbi:MAG: hypothetical protein ACQESR_26725 [Planctomycetota bacterium]
MEGCPTQAVLPFVGLAADTVIRDRYTSWLLNGPCGVIPFRPPGSQIGFDRYHGLIRGGRGRLEGPSC